jgi:hypothetical protein
MKPSGPTTSRDFMYTLPRRAWGYGRVELGKCGTIPARRIAGYQWGRGGGETTLSERLLCGHKGAFHSSGAVPSGGTILRAGCRMGP